MKLSVFVGIKLGLNTITEEIALVPFRCLKNFMFNKLVDFILFSRVSLTENKTTKHLFFKKGFTSYFIQLLWAVFGGFMM